MWWYKKQLQEASLHPAVKNCPAPTLTLIMHTNIDIDKMQKEGERCGKVNQ